MGNKNLIHERHNTAVQYRLVHVRVPNFVHPRMLLPIGALDPQKLHTNTTGSQDLGGFGGIGKTPGSRSKAENLCNVINVTFFSIM